MNHKKPPSKMVIDSPHSSPDMQSRLEDKFKTIIKNLKIQSPEPTPKNKHKSDKQQFFDLIQTTDDKINRLETHMVSKRTVVINAYKNRIGDLLGSNQDIADLNCETAIIEFLIHKLSGFLDNIADFQKLRQDIDKYHKLYQECDEERRKLELEIEVLITTNFDLKAEIKYLYSNMEAFKQQIQADYQQDIQTLQQQLNYYKQNIDKTRSDYQQVVQSLQDQHLVSLRTNNHNEKLVTELTMHNAKLNLELQRYQQSLDNLQAQANQLQESLITTQHQCQLWKERAQKAGYVTKNTILDSIKGYLQSNHTQEIMPFLDQQIQIVRG